MANNILFITGIDTDVGKTIATGIYAKKLAEQGKRVITQKLVQTGCHAFSEDIQKHRNLQGIPLQQVDIEKLTCRFIYPYPCSPHLAARMADKAIDLQAIHQDTENLAKRHDMVLIEGAGGLYVPLSDNYFLIDYIAEHNYPIILVTSGKLGSLNHTLLSLEACKQRNLRVHSLIYNQFPQTDPIIEEETQRFLRTYINTHFPNCEFMLIPDMS